MTDYWKNKRLVLKRLSVLEIIGKQCVNCGYDENINNIDIDHTNNDGKADRQKFNNNSYRLYNFYLKNPNIAKQKLQPLCKNCNWKKKVNYERKIKNYLEDWFLCEKCRVKAIYSITWGHGKFVGQNRLLCGACFNLEQIEFKNDIDNLIYLNQAIERYYEP